MPIIIIIIVVTPVSCTLHVVNMHFSLDKTSIHAVLALAVGHWTISNFPVVLHIKQCGYTL